MVYVRGTAIHAAASGEAIFSPSITLRLTEYLATSDRGHKAFSDQIFSNLTEREHEVLTLMAEGYTNSAVASTLAQNGAQLRLEHLHQAAGIRQVPGKTAPCIRAHPLRTTSHQQLAISL